MKSIAGDDSEKTSQRQPAFLHHRLGQPLSSCCPIQNKDCCPVEDRTLTSRIPSTDGASNKYNLNRRKPDVCCVRFSTSKELYR